MFDLAVPSTVSVGWEGWLDSGSGLREFELELYKMQPFGDVLGTSHEGRKEVEKFNETILDHQFTLSEPAMYCFLLTTEDNVRQHTLARKFVLFDDQNRVEVLPDPDRAMRVESAAANTSYLWITTLHQAVSLSWRGHFMNRFHHQHKLLNAVRPHSPAISSSYEQRTGQPPSIRSMQTIPNVNGVIGYDLQVKSDQSRGRNATTPDPGTWQTVANFQAERAEFTVSRFDGDSMQLFVKGRDAMQNEVIDSILVHVDSSPPVLSITGLIQNGHRGLTVHNLTQSFHMRLDLQADDVHSGLLVPTLTWELHLTENPTIIPASGELPVKKTEPGNPGCSLPGCICVATMNMCYFRDYQVELDASKLPLPEGRFEIGYYFLITVTNNAKLVTSRNFSITLVKAKEQPELGSTTQHPRLGSKKGGPHINYMYVWLPIVILVCVLVSGITALFVIKLRNKKKSDQNSATRNIKPVENMAMEEVLKIKKRVLSTGNTAERSGQPENQVVPVSANNVYEELVPVSANNVYENVTPRAKNSDYASIKPRRVVLPPETKRY